MQREITRRGLIGGLGLAGGAAAFGSTASAVEPPAAMPANLPVWNVRASGAVGDGTTLNTPAFQSAIDACAAAGGGTVFFPPGRYLTGGMILKSRVNLQFAPGAVLVGSPRLEDYPVQRPTLVSRSHLYVQHALIYGEKLDCIGIRGPGILDGQGAEFRKQFGAKWRVRPYLIRLIECRDVWVEDITLTQSAMWAMLFVACRRVRVRGVGVSSHAAANNDGFDIDACEDVAISDCFIDSGDDSIVLKSTYDRPCRNVAVTNCVLASRTNAFKLGAEGLGGFQNITLSNCVIQPPPEGRRDGVSRSFSGVSLQMVDGGKLERVVISNLAIEGVEAAIFLRLGNRGARVKETDPRPDVGLLRDVSIANIVGRNIGPTGCALVGVPGHPIEDVALENISLRFAGGGTREEAQRYDVPELEGEYPESTMFGRLPAYGFYARHGRNLRLRNLDLGYERADVRPPLVCEDVERLEVAGLAAQTDAKTDCVFRLRNVREAFIHGCRLKNPTLQVAEMDADCRDIRWAANAFDAPK
ncbi:MAG: twin-arginine translocation signal domain-containing protein [Pirellulales bacterium]|nr:twin-arginine translocation signal domain-containing protein [Pirellulales bacterium]